MDSPGFRMCARVSQVLKVLAKSYGITTPEPQNFQFKSTSAAGSDILPQADHTDLTLPHKLVYSTAE